MLVAQAALAEEASGPTKCAQVRKRDPHARCKDLALDGDEVEGAKAVPDGVVVSGRQTVKWGSLIKLRVSMVDQIVRSAESLPR